jgi:hypothetical protein
MPRATISSTWAGAGRRGLDRVDELRLVDVVVAADDRDDEPAVAGDEERGLRGPALRDVEERASASIVVASGVSTSSIGRASSAGGSGLRTSAICWFSA